MDIDLRKTGEEEPFEHWSIDQVELLDFKNAEAVLDTWLSFEGLSKFIDGLALREEVENWQLIPVKQETAGTNGPLGIFNIRLRKEDSKEGDKEQEGGRYLFVERVALMQEILRQIWEMYHSDSNVEIILR